MFDEVVVVVGPDERDELGDAGKPVEVLVQAEEGLPLVVTLTPPRCPQRDDVSVGQSELDRDDVSGHGSQP